MKAIPTTYKIGEVAKQLGISASMIRAWEKLGLARPSRTDSRYRLYTAGDLRVLKRAVYLRKVLGLNAPAIVAQLRQEGFLPEKPTVAADSLAFGARLRKLRSLRSESLAQVAAAVGVSPAFLSSLERGQVNASIGVLRKIAQHYAVNILDFFNTRDGSGVPHVRPKERKVLSGGPGVQMELLAWGSIVMEPHLFRVAPKGGSSEFYSHDGEEFLYVIQGELTIHLNETTYHLSAGDSFYFESQTPHRWHNPARSEAVLLWVNTPPTF